MLNNKQQIKLILNKYIDTSDNYEQIKKRIHRGIQTVINPSLKSINDFLSIKYFYICDNSEVEQYGYKLIKTTDKYKLYENSSAKPLGFIVNSYISQKEFFEKSSIEERQNVVNNMVILTKNQIKKYKNLFKGNLEYTSTDFKFRKNSFTSKIKTNKDALVIYTIPYDKGWQATVNQKDVTIEKVDNGVMAIKVSKGTNNIKFKYFPPGLKIGLMLSTLSLAGYILYRKSKFFF